MPPSRSTSAAARRPASSSRSERNCGWITSMQPLDTGHPRLPRKVELDRRRPARELTLDERLHRAPLVRPDLDERDAAGRQRIRKAFEEPRDEGQPVLAAVERDPGLEGGGDRKRGDRGG